MFPAYPYPKVSVVICTFNEEANLSHVLPKIPCWIDEILLIDGHSVDKTVDVAKALCPNVKVLLQPGSGKGDAMRYGFKHARGDVIVTIDADGSTDPEDIPKFIRPLLSGSDLAKGSRFSLRFPADKSTHRIFGNLLIATTFNLLYGCRYTDICSGYNAFWKRILKQINFDSKDCFEDEPLLIARVKKAKLKIVEVGHIDYGRIHGVSKAPSWRQGFKAIKTLLRERIDG